MPFADVHCERKTVCRFSTIDTCTLSASTSINPQEKQRFLQYLSYKCNTLTEEVESSVFGKAMMDLFLESYSLDELSNMPLEDLVDYLRKKVKNRFPNPVYVAKSIQKAVRSSYRLNKVVEDTIDTILGTSITLIRTFKKQIKELNQSIERILKGLPQTLQTVPGVGPVFTAGIIAKIGQIDCFEDETKIASIQVCIGVNINLVALQQMVHHYCIT